jgi:hypothetical protein
MPNIASRLTDIAQQYPDTIAIAEPNGKRGYRTITFAELDRDTDRIAAALLESGVQPGMRLALFVRYGIDFISLVFALCKANVTLVLIDPGMGIRRMLDCLAEVEPDGFVAIPPVHAVRLLMRHRFPKAKYHLTVGKRWFWGGLSLEEIRKTKNERAGVSPPVSPNQPAQNRGANATPLLAKPNPPRLPWAYFALPLGWVAIALFFLYAFVFAVSGTDFAGAFGSCFYASLSFTIVLCENFSSHFPAQ